MGYVDAYRPKDSEEIHVVERVNGARVYKTYPVDHSFYVSDPKGRYQSIFGTAVAKITPRTQKEFRKEVQMLQGRKTWETDLNLVFKCLSQNYLDAKSPSLHVAKLDIEVDFDPERGYSDPADPFNAITAITVHLNWTDQLITLVLKPKTLSIETAQKICDEFENTILYTDERQMITDFFDVIDDADVITGWNSGGFDLPYMVNRTVKIMDKETTRRFCLWNEKPKVKIYELYGKEQSSYDLIGRVHLDYLDLYKKFTYEERHSYSLNAIAEYELGESKTAYDGSLDALYNQDFRKFIEYNRQDVILLVKIDDKKKLLDLANEMAHNATVTMMTTLGTVALSDQAVINRAHKRGQIVPDKQHAGEEEDAAAGAYVAYPKKGRQDWIGVMDINGLYPSAIRTLNMGPDTIVGQFRQDMTENALRTKMRDGCSFAAAWEGMFGCLEYQAIMRQDKSIKLVVDWEGTNTSDELTAAEAYKLIFTSGKNWCLSGNGTIFTYDHDSIIPEYLADNATVRKELQTKRDELIRMDKSSLSDAEKKEIQNEISQLDLRQTVRKLLSNSFYGSLLNRAFRFHDKRIGQSVTLTGRVIVKHMCSFINECITGEYDYKGDAIQYGDTDSSNFSAYKTLKPKIDSGEIVWNRDTVVELYRAIAEKTNNSWVEFMEKAFHTPPQYGKLLRANLESIGERALYITKKRYAILNYYKDGIRYDGKEKLKAMGLDLRRADTPEICQKFLADLLRRLLNGCDKEELIETILAFKAQFSDLPIWEKGTPKRVNKLSYYRHLIDTGMGNRVPGHVRASLHWNALCDMHGDNYSPRIDDGDKVVVCKLKENAMKFTSIAYPVDLNQMPRWFAALPFNSDEMEAAVVNKKIQNLLSQIDEWKEIEERITPPANTFNSFFS